MNQKLLFLPSKFFVQEMTNTFLQPRYNPKYKNAPQFQIQKVIFSTTLQMIFQKLQKQILIWKWICSL